MMLSSYPLWWLALPVLLLPVWWHRQKRQRLKAELLATARFLPSAPPEQLRVWQWRDKTLLLVRCLLLVTLIAWLAATIIPWRGDTVLVDAGADKAWVEQEINAAGFGAASRITLPPNGLQWLRANERDWRTSTKLLVVARASHIAMPARIPQFSHQVELRTTSAAGQNVASPANPKPAASTATAAAPAAGTGQADAAPSRREQHVAVVAPAGRDAAWRSLFSAFDVAGNATKRYKLTTAPDATTTLIVWDTPDAAPPANWRAAHWWIAASSSAARAAFPELARASTLTINGITLQYADSPRGRLWTSNAFPPHDADTAQALYESWQLLSAAPSPAYATPSHTFDRTKSTPPITDAKPAPWLAVILLALFITERILTHARRS